MAHKLAILGLLTVGLIAPLLQWVMASEVVSPPALAEAAKTDAEIKAKTQKPHALLGNLPLYFIENQGQTDAQVAYYVTGKDTSLYFTSEGVTFSFIRPASPVASGDAGTKSLLPSEEPAMKRHVVKLDFIGASSVKPKGEEPQSAKINHFKGPKEQWKTGIPTYARLVYPNLWPGIDLAYSGRAGLLEHRFVVKPGSDPARIRLSYRGVDALTHTKAGQLLGSTSLGSFLDDKPSAYQEVEGKRAEVTVAYLSDPMHEGKRDKGDFWGFKVGPYDKTKPLNITVLMH